MSQEGAFKGVATITLYHGRFKIDMCACNTFLCTYYLQRPQSVNIDWGTVAFADIVLSTNGFWE